MTRPALALAVLLAWVRIAVASPEETFQSALAAGDIDALERLGAERPVTRWTDDAWSEAGRLALRANDTARARRAFEQAALLGTDAQLVRRAKAELARLTAATGATGEWTAVAAEHDRLVATLYASGDPRASLDALGVLVRTHPGYPRRVTAMLTLASVWEREGEGAVAVGWLREARTTAAPGLEHLRVHAELIRTLIRTGELATARDELAALPSPPSLVADLRGKLERAQLRRTVRGGMLVLLAILAIAAVVALRRAAGSWRAAARRLARPPSEAIYLLPIAVVLVIVAYTGNPLVARAVRTIVIAGLAVSWISGAILAERPTLRRALIHAICAVLAVGAVTYLAVDDGHLIDFVLETWRAGHERG